MALRCVWAERFGGALTFIGVRHSRLADCCTTSGRARTANSGGPSASLRTSKPPHSTWSYLWISVGAGCAVGLRGNNEGIIENGQCGAKDLRRARCIVPLRNRSLVMIEGDGAMLPSTLAGHGMPCPYEETARPQRRWMGGAVPRILAGHDVSCPYATIRRR